VQVIACSIGACFSISRKAGGGRFHREALAPGGSFARPTEITVGTKVATTQLSLGFHEALVVPGAGVLEDQR
jgi:hypothetical protein